MKKSILLMDDNILILSTLAKGLKLSGYQTFTAKSGAEALKIVDSVTIDIAVLDICIPGECGIGIARQIISDHVIPVIFLSAYSDEEIVSEAVSSGCMNYLVKPCSLEQLCLTIESVYEKAKEFKQLKEHNEHLNKALSQSQDICIATGLLMKEYDLDQKQAFEKLRTLARSSRCKITDLAKEFISTCKKN